MPMITELEVKEAKVLGGRKIQAIAYRTANYSLYQCMKPLSLGIFWMLECDSNNTKRTVIPRDIIALRDQFQFFKEEYGMAKKQANAPTTVLESSWKLLFPDNVEMARFANKKIERVAMAIYQLARVSMTVDSAGTKGYVDWQDFSLIDESIKACEEVMDKFLGTGKVIDVGAGKYDTGVPMPAMSEIGVLVPDNDLDYWEAQEPTADQPDTGLPDKPDTPVEGPKEKLS